jgi:outer membrane protein OmpA-like peptidoglycan-associated protein
VRLDGRWIMVDHGGSIEDQQNLEGNVGLAWTFGGAPPKDSDGDGVADGKDRCPATPRGATVDERGCPTDADGDGVVDGLDKCPMTTAGTPVDGVGCQQDTDGDGVHDGADRCLGTPKGAAVDATGCPKDTDGDGVTDGLDRCPDTPKGVVVDASGCAKDTDGDGVPDGLDKCANTPKGAAIDAAGCPTDADGDGVSDNLDKCANTPRGTKVDAAGCPELFAAGSTKLVLEGVTFENASDRLTAESRTMLDRVATSLVGNPAVHVEVAGHADSNGLPASNEALSLRRAQSVRSYLISKGVSADRLTARGYGEADPIADNTTAEGRAKNRRVELKKR